MYAVRLQCPRVSLPDVCWLRQHAWTRNQFHQQCQESEGASTFGKVQCIGNWEELHTTSPRIEHSVAHSIEARLESVRSHSGAPSMRSFPRTRRALHWRRDTHMPARASWCGGVSALSSRGEGEGAHTGDGYVYTAHGHVPAPIAPSMAL